MFRPSHDEPCYQRTLLLQRQVPKPRPWLNNINETKDRSYLPSSEQVAQLYYCSLTITLQDRWDQKGRTNHPSSFFTYFRSSLFASFCSPPSLSPVCLASNRCRRLWQAFRGKPTKKIDTQPSLPTFIKPAPVPACTKPLSWLSRSLNHSGSHTSALQFSEEKQNICKGVDTAVQPIFSMSSTLHQVDVMGCGRSQNPGILVNTQKAFMSKSTTVS